MIWLMKSIWFIKYVILFSHGKLSTICGKISVIINSFYEYNLNSNVSKYNLIISTFVTRKFILILFYCKQVSTLNFKQIYKRHYVNKIFGCISVTMSPIIIINWIGNNIMFNFEY